MMHACYCTTTCCSCSNNHFYFTISVPCVDTIRFPSWVLPGAHKTWIIWCSMKRAMPTFVEPVLRLFEPLRPSRIKRVRARRHAVNHSPRRRRA